MRQLKRKHKLAIVFSLYFFLFLIILSGLFYFIFKITLEYQTKKDLIHEVSEISQNHIGLEKDQLVFVRDDKGETLRLHLFTDNISAIFLNPDKTIIRKYGEFESDAIIQSEAISSLIEDVSINDRTEEKTVNIAGLVLKTLAVPIKFGNQTEAYMILARSLTSVSQTTATVSWVLFSFGVIGLLGSIGVGFFLSNKAYSPLGYIARQIDGIDLERLENIIRISGNPDDELVMLSNKFNQMIDRLAEMSQRQKEFISNTSHELKTPLTKAVSSLELLAYDMKERKHDLMEVRDELLDINSLLDNLLLLSKVRQTAFAPKGSSEIKTVFDKVRKLLNRDLLAKELKLNLSLENFQTAIPEKYLEIIFINLYSNAIKFSKSKGTITVKSVQKPEKKFCIIDGGIGVEKKQKPEIFKRFYRTKEARNYGKGQGIGLSLVKELCELYNIRIVMSSEEDKGTDISLTFTD